MRIGVVVGDADGVPMARHILYWAAGVDVLADSYFGGIRWVCEDAVLLGGQLEFGFKMSL